MRERQGTFSSSDALDGWGLLRWRRRSPFLRGRLLVAKRDQRGECDQGYRSSTDHFALSISRKVKGHSIWKFSRSRKTDRTFPVAMS